MRSTTVAGFALSFLVALATLAPTRTARAEEEFDVKTDGGKVVVTTKGTWHINKDYPWKLKVGDKVLDKSKFKIEEKSATVAGAPHGAATLSGAVCSGDQCKPFKKDMTL